MNRFPELIILLSLSTLLTERKIVDFMVYGAFGTLNERQLEIRH